MNNETPDTPWTNWREHECSNLNGDCRVLERHLRTIIAAADEYERDGESAALMSVIKQAEQELNK